MINKIQNNRVYNQSFTSDVRMHYLTATTLGQYKKSIQKAIYRQLQALEANGENNLVNITHRYQLEADNLIKKDIIRVQVLQKDGNNVILASPVMESEISTKRQNKNKKLTFKTANIISLYKKAKQNLAPLSEDNIFSRFI